MQEKDAIITSQVAVKGAVELAVAGKIDPTAIPATAGRLSELIGQLATSSAPTQVTPQVAVENLQAAGLQPQVVGGDFATLDQDERWAYFLNNRDKFWDNRDGGGTSIAGGTKPDFRHKDAKDDQGRNIGLWLKDAKYGKHAPDAVFTALGYAAPSAPPTAPVDPSVAQPAPGVPAPW